MGYSSLKIVVYLALFVSFNLAKDSESECDLRSIPSTCPKFETCIPDSNGAGRCKCLAGQKRNDNGKCTPQSSVTTAAPEGVTAAPRILPPEPEHDSITSGSSVAAGILIPLVVIACLVSVVLLARRYRWPQRLRQLRSRHYDEMQIGQDDDDDPPIA